MKNQVLTRRTRDATSLPRLAAGRTKKVMVSLIRCDPYRRHLRRGSGKVGCGWALMVRRLELVTPHGCVNPIACNQVVMASTLHHVSGIHHHHQISIDHSGQAMCDDEGGLATRKSGQGLLIGRTMCKDTEKFEAEGAINVGYLHFSLSRGVDGGGGFVAQKDRSILQERTSYSDTLLLSARELQSALTNDGIIAMLFSSSAEVAGLQRAPPISTPYRHQLDGVVDTSQPGRFHNLLTRGAWPAIGNVVINSVVEEDGVL